MEKEVNLEEILKKTIIASAPADFTEINYRHFTASIAAMHEACRQVLELASENAEVIKKSRLGENGIWKTEYIIIKDSITNTINQLK